MKIIDRITKKKNNESPSVEDILSKTLRISGYIFFGLFFLLAFSKDYFERRYTKSLGSKQTRSFISVIVPFRNEGERILYNAQTLAEADYPKHLYEVIFVDDGSTDGTTDLLAPFLEGNDNFRLIRLTERIRGLAGKQSAIHTAIMQSNQNTEIIVNVDAGSRVPTTYLSKVNKHLTAGIGLIIGNTDVFFKQNKPTLWGGLEAFILDAGLKSFMYLTAFKREALGGCGRNLAYKKGAYLNMGGYPKLGQATLEDKQLVQAFQAYDSRYKEGGYKVIAGFEKEMKVSKLFNSNFKQTFQRHRRWMCTDELSFDIAVAIICAVIVLQLLLVCYTFLKPRKAFLGIFAYFIFCFQVLSTASKSVGIFYTLCVMIVSPFYVPLVYIYSLLPYEYIWR